MDKKLILVVEDEETTRDVIAQALDIFGYDTILAENGKIALEKYDEHKPDMVISDIYMPEMNGLDLLKALRKKNNKLPVVLITGYDIQEAHKNAKTYGVTAMLLKPFRLQQLKDILEKEFKTV